MALAAVSLISLLCMFLCYIYFRRSMPARVNSSGRKVKYGKHNASLNPLKPLKILTGRYIASFRNIHVHKKENKDEELANDVIDYNKYDMSSKEYLKYFIQASACTVACGYLFYRNIYITAILWALSFVYPKLKKKELIKKRKKQLSLQFRDALQAVSSSLSAGRSIENAFKAAVNDLKILYPSQNTYIIKEFEIIARRINMNETLKTALYDFEKRAGIDDITNFVDVFAICKDTGGNLVEVIKNTCNIINQKIDIVNEIDVIVAEQKFSQKILNIMPFGLMFMIITSSPDYLEPLYTPLGHVVMSVVLGLLLLSYYISNRIMDIKV